MAHAYVPSCILTTIPTQSRVVSEPSGCQGIKGMRTLSPKAHNSFTANLLKPELSALGVIAKTKKNAELMH